MTDKFLDFLPILFWLYMIGRVIHSWIWANDRLKIISDQNNRLIDSPYLTKLTKDRVKDVIDGTYFLFPSAFEVIVLKFWVWPLDRTIPNDLRRYMFDTQIPVWSDFESKEHAIIYQKCMDMAKSLKKAK